MSPVLASTPEADDDTKLPSPARNGWRSTTLDAEPAQTAACGGPVMNWPDATNPTCVLGPTAVAPLAGQPVGFRSTTLAADPLQRRAWFCPRVEGPRPEPTWTL